MVSDWQLMRIHYQGGCDFAGSHVFGGCVATGRPDANERPPRSRRPPVMRELERYPLSHNPDRRIPACQVLNVKLCSCAADT